MACDSKISAGADKKIKARDSDENFEKKDSKKTLMRRKFNIDHEIERISSKLEAEMDKIIQETAKKWNA